MNKLKIMMFDLKPRTFWGIFSVSINYSVISNGIVLKYGLQDEVLDTEESIEETKNTQIILR